MKNTKDGITRHHPFAHLIGPIDWAAWMAEAAGPRGAKGKKRSPEQKARLSAAQKKRFAERRAQLAELLQREAATPPPPPPYDPLACVTATDRILGAMQPDSWYALPGLAKLSGVKYQSCKAFAVTWCRKADLLVRTQNPVWKPPERPGMRQEPKWLYRLSKQGEQRHRLSAALL